MVTAKLLNVHSQRPKNMKATQKYIRTSARKLRLVADAVRGLPVIPALNYLKFMEKRAAEPLYKAIKAALAAGKNQGEKEDNLIVKIIDIGEGPTYKRWRAVSRGGAHSIAKRTSHIRVSLEGKNGTKS